MAPREIESRERPGGHAPPTPREHVLQPALRLLSNRARSVRDLRDRLLKKDHDPTEVEECLRWLEDRGLLDDEAFSRSLILERIRFSPRSPFLLQRDLTDKGVPPGLAERMVETVLDEEALSGGDLSSRAAEAWARKQSGKTRRDLLRKRFTPEREKARRRLYGFLLRRGFVGDSARRGMEAGVEQARKLESLAGPGRNDAGDEG